MILQRGLNSQGKLILRATSDGQTSGEISIDVTPAVARPAATALANPPLVILNWKRSPVTAERPDPNQQPLNTDVNTWTNAHPGSWLPPFRDGRFAIYRAEFTPRSGVQKSGGPLILHDVFGKAQVWIDGKLAGEKPDTGKGNLTVACPAGDGEKTVSVLIEAAAPDTPAGLGGLVTVE